MKTTLLSILAILALTTACSKNNSFSIEGSLSNDANNGKMVYLQELKLDGSGEISIDSTRIQDKKFSFKGIADSVCVRFITIADATDNVESTSVVILEPGVINVSIDNIATVTGTPINEQYREMVNQDRVLEESYNGLQRNVSANQATAENITPEFTAEVKKKYKVLISEKGRIRFDFLRQNMQNSAGEFFFLSSLMVLEPNQMIELISLSRPSFQAQESVANIKEQAEMLGSMNMRDPLEE